MAEGLQEAGASSHGRASVIGTTLTKIIQRFIGLSSIFTHSCYSKPFLSEKMQFSCRPRDAGRVANNATHNNQEILVQQTQNVPEKHADG